MSDARGYFKITNSLPEHRKIMEVGGDAAWLHVCAIAFCSRNLTDGIAPLPILYRLSDRKNPKKLASKLVEAGLWHISGHGCARCPEIEPGNFYIHDYLQHQTSAYQAHATSEARAIAGKKGGMAPKKGSNLLSKTSSKLLSKNEAEVEVEVKLKKLTTSLSPTAAPWIDEESQEVGGRSDPGAPAIRADVEKLCGRLVELMIENKCKPPTITQTWRDEARRMFDLDERPFDKAIRLLEWSQQDAFWRANIHSIPKFRKKYDELRLKANREWEVGAASARLQTDAQKIDAAMERALALEAALEEQNRAPGKEIVA